MTVIVRLTGEELALMMGALRHWSKHNRAEADRCGETRENTKGRRHLWISSGAQMLAGRCEQLAQQGAGDPVLDVFGSHANDPCHWCQIEIGTLRYPTTGQGESAMICALCFAGSSSAP